MSACSRQQPAGPLGLLAVRKLCRVLQTDSPLLLLQMDVLMNSEEGKWLLQQGISPITWLGGGGCAQVYM